MEYLAQNGYHVLPLARLEDFLAGKTPLPRKSVVITIDDGYRSTYEIAYPILKKYGFPGDRVPLQRLRRRRRRAHLGADEGDDGLRARSTSSRTRRRTPT